MQSTILSQAGNFLKQYQYSRFYHPTHNLPSLQSTTAEYNYLEVALYVVETRCITLFMQSAKEAMVSFFTWLTHIRAPPIEKLSSTLCETML